MLTSRSSVYPASLLLIVALLFVHPLAGGYDTSVAVALITWVGIGVCILLASVATIQNPTKLNSAALIFVAMAVAIALRQGPLPVSTLGTVFTLLIMAVWAVCVSLLSNDTRYFNALMGGLVVAAFSNALIALYQYFGWAMSHPLPFIKPTEAGYALGQVNQRNLLAFLCVLGLVIVIYCEEWRKSTWARWMMCAVGMILTAGAAATASRSGALSFVALSLLVFLSRHYLSAFTRRMALGFAFLYIGLSFFLPWLSGFNSVFARFTDGEGVCHSRMILWSNAATMIKAAPWFGHGWGSFISTFYATGFEQRFCEFPDHAHNLFLQLGAELGIPIAIAAATYCLWLLTAQRGALKGSSQRKIGYSMVVLSLTYSQTEFPLWNADFLAVFAIALGILFTPQAGHRTTVIANTKGNLKIRLVTAVFGVFAIFAGIVGHYQYNRVSQLNLHPNLRDHDLRVDPHSTLRAYWLFSNQLLYARIHNEQVTQENAKKVLDDCLTLLIYAPAPAVVIKVIESAKLLGNQDIEAFHTQRLKEIYPVQYKKWKTSLQANGQIPPK